MRPADAGLASFLDTTTAVPAIRHLLTVTPRVGSVVRWTDHERDLLVSAQTYLAGGEGTTHPLVVVGGLDYGHGTDRIDKLPLSLLCADQALFNGVRLPLFAAQRGFDKALVKIERVFFTGAGTWTTPMWWWEGPAGEAKVSSLQVDLDVESGLSFLATRLLPRQKFQAACVHMVYDAECALVRASFTQTGFTVAASPAPTTTTFSFATGTLSTDPGRVAEFYRLGMVKFTSGALSGLERGVRSYAWAANVGAVTLDKPLPSAPATGVTFEIFPGCPKTLAACANNTITVGPAFNNKVHFRGWPFVPRNEAAI